jgi:hypothetical protein
MRAASLRFRVCMYVSVNVYTLHPIGCVHMHACVCVCACVRVYVRM